MNQTDARAILDSAHVSWEIATVLPTSPPGLWQPVLLVLVTVLYYFCGYQASAATPAAEVASKTAACAYCGVHTH